MLAISLLDSGFPNKAADDDLNSGCPILSWLAYLMSGALKLSALKVIWLYFFADYS